MNPVMYNLPKCDSEKNSKNLNKNYEIRCSQTWWSLPSFKNIVEAISTGELATHFSVTTEGIDKPVFQMI